MDTNDTMEPVGVEGATSSQDTSNDIAQTEESTDSVSDGQVEESVEAPELLAGKYKSPQELEKAYLEAQRKIGEQGQKAEIANLIEQQTGMNALQIKEYLARQQQEQLMQQYQDNPGGMALQEIQALKSQIALQNEEKSLNDFISSPEGQPYQAFKDKIFKLGLNLERDKSYSDIAREYFGEARARGQQDAYKKIENKIMTQATGPMSAPQKKFSPEDLKQMSTSEMEQFLPRA